jgi:hypothetical protein
MKYVIVAKRWQRNGGAPPPKGREHQSRVFGPMLPCAASGTGGRGKGTGRCCLHRRPQSHVPASGQSSQGCRCPSQSPSVDLAKPDGFCDAQADARLAPVSTSANGGASSSHAKKKRGPKVQAEPLGNVHLHRLHFRWQPRPSRGETRTALGQFRSQRHRRCNRARRFSKPLPNRRAVEGPNRFRDQPQTASATVARNSASITLGHERHPWGSRHRSSPTLALSATRCGNSQSFGSTPAQGMSPAVD